MIDLMQNLHSFERFDWNLGLERVKGLLLKLGDPQNGVKCIHVTGTNGKGSVCRFIYEMLRENGYKAGLFTSPHIEVINERIEYDGRRISDEELEACSEEVIEKVKEMTDQGLDAPTTFEVLTAVAFVYFRRMNAEIVVLEVGLGGRGDATNVIEKPLVSVITSVAFDHTDFLGDTLTEIASEKAGIIKEGAPVVSNVRAREAAEVIEAEARRLNCGLYDAAKIKYEIVSRTVAGSVFNVSVGGREYKNVEIKLLGEHQIQNAVTALYAFTVIWENGDIKAAKRGIYRGLKLAGPIGRFEILRKNPYVIIDGAHNESGAGQLEKTMKEYFGGEKTLMITGMLADKDTSGILGHFYGITDDFIATAPQDSRKLSADVLCSEIRSAGKNCIAALDPVAACKKADELSGKYDIILFTGSLYLLGAVRRFYA